MRIDEFLLSRVAEDEAVARSVAESIDREEYFASIVADSYELAGDDCPERVADYDPARVLAECEAKRRLVAEHGPKDPDPYASWKTPEYHESQRKAWAADGLNYDPDKWLVCAECDHKYPCRTVRHIANIYADHPDFDPAWRL